MKIPAKNKTIVEGVAGANDDDNSNVVVEEEGNESGDDTITEMDEEFIHAQKTAKRRPSLQQASPDQTNLDELRVIEDQKRIFTETLSEIPCESEIYRLYELISSPAFEETAGAPPGQRQSLSSNPRRKSGDIPSPSPTATEAKHLFEEIFYTLLTDYRNKKSDLEKYSSLYKEKAKECKDLAEKLNSVSLHGFENPNSETGESERQESSSDLQLIRNRFPSSTGLSPTTIRVSRPSNSTLSPYTIELPSDVRGSKSSIGDINTTPSYEKFRANSVSRRDSFTQTLPSLLVVNKASPARKKEDSVESVDYLNTKVSDRIFNVILAGDTSVGKTSLLIQFCQNYFDPETHSTLGIDCHTKTVIYEGLKVTLKIWDTVGQERFRSLTKSYFRRADGIMLVYDSTQEDSLVNIRYWMDTIKETASKHDISIVICANKCDLIPREPSAHTLNSLALDIANENDAAFWRMSAKTGKNVENGFMSLIKMMIDREDNELFKTTAISLKSARPTPSKKCCE